MSPTFATSYCSQHRIPAVEFERVVLRRILYPHARLLAPLIRAIQPEYFSAELELVRAVGSIRHLRNFHAACADYRLQLKHAGAARRLLRLRGSARALFHLAEDALSPTSLARAAYTPATPPTART